MDFRFFKYMSTLHKEILFSLPFYFSLLLIPAYFIQIFNIFGVLSINTDLALEHNSVYNIRDVEDFDGDYAILKPTETMTVESDEDGFLASVQVYPMDNVVKLSRGTKSITVTYPSFLSTEVVDDESDVTRLKIAFDDFDLEVDAFDTVCNIYKTDYGYRLVFPDKEGFTVSVKEMPEIEETNEGTYELSNRVKYYAPRGNEVLVFNLDGHPKGGYMIESSGVLLKSVDDYKPIGFDMRTLVLSFISLFFLVVVLDYVRRKIEFDFRFNWLNYLGTALYGLVVGLAFILLF